MARHVLLGMGLIVNPAEQAGSLVFRNHRSQHLHHTEKTVAPDWVNRRSAYDKCKK